MAKKKASRTTKKKVAATKSAASKKSSFVSKKNTRQKTKKKNASKNQPARIQAITPDYLHEAEVSVTRGGLKSPFLWEDSESSDDNGLGSEEEFNFVPLADFRESEPDENTRGRGDSEMRPTLQPELQRCLGEAAGPATRGRIDGENRKQIANPRQYPFSAVCCLEMRRGSSSQFSIGTGVLVGRNLVLTAGHNLIHNPVVGQPDRVNVYPGRTGPNGKWPGVQAVAMPSQFWISDPWRTQKDKALARALDWGFIILNEPLYASAGSLGLIPWEKSRLLETSGFMVAGYPSSKVSDSPNRSNPFTLWYDVGKVSNVGDRTLLYGMDTSEGQSGAPLIAWDSSKTSTGNMICVGIHNYDAGGFNQATRVTPALISQIEPFLK
jgi:V8-like Glu-specific endopeptidase